MEAKAKLEAAVAATDRRRPGRVGYDNPDLVALMRGKLPFEAGAMADPAPPLGEEDDLPVRQGSQPGVAGSDPSGHWLASGCGGWSDRRPAPPRVLRSLE